MIIGKALSYRSGWHKALEGLRFEIVSLHRGENILEDDTMVGDLHDGDWLEVAPFIKGDEKERLSFVTYDALPSHLNWQD